jgi:cyclic-di-GMP-binding protein
MGNYTYTLGGMMMAKESSFDIVSKVDLSEVTNAINITMKEISTRYDFKGSKSNVTLDKEELVLISDDEYKLEQLKDVLLGKMIKRGIPIRNLDYGKIEGASGGTVRQRAKLVQGIDKDNAKKINTLIKNSGLKVKSQVQDDQVRVTAKSRDDLQAVIAAVKDADLTVDVQFVNYR